MLEMAAIELCMRVILSMEAICETPLPLSDI